MLFSVQEAGLGLVWVPVDCNGGSFDTLYNGQLVKSGSDGVLPLGAASGAADTSTKAIPFGVIVGNNLKEQLYNSTYHTNYITSKSPHDNTTEYVSVEGPWGKGDKSAMVLVHMIGPQTKIRGGLYGSSFGTVLAEQTVTTGSAAGSGYTAGAAGFTPVADLCTIYCRKGANLGCYRITTDTSTTVRTVDHYFPADIAIGDKFCAVGIRHSGSTYMQLDSESTYILGENRPATNYFIVTVEKLDLSESGKESCTFRFATCHFDSARA